MRKWIDNVFSGERVHSVKKNVKLSFSLCLYIIHLYRNQKSYIVETFLLMMNGWMDSYQQKTSSWIRLFLWMEWKRRNSVDTPWCPNSLSILPSNLLDKKKKKN
jgi:hypothetical protein